MLKYRKMAEAVVRRNLGYAPAAKEMSNRHDRFVDEVATLLLIVSRRTLEDAAFDAEESIPWSNVKKIMVPWLRERAKNTDIESEAA